MKTMFSFKDTDLKLASIGQSLMQAVRPRATLAPLQLSLGVQMHHHFASYFLVDTLSEHEFSCSYAEVQRYERSAAVAHGTHTTTYSEENFIQFIADNVYHNIATLDGTGAFHGMGIIATITPKPQVCRPSIPKLHVTAEDIAAIDHINIDYFKIPSSIQCLTYQPIHKPQACDPTSPLDIMWKTSLLIDLEPSDPSCDPSCIYIRSVPDDNDLKKIVLRLGSFPYPNELLMCNRSSHVRLGSAGASRGGLCRKHRESHDEWKGSLCTEQSVVICWSMQH